MARARRDVVMGGRAVMFGRPTGLAALSSRRGLRRVLVAYALYDFVEFFAWLSVILWAFDQGGVGLAGLAAIVQLVPAALIAPAVAGMGDRIPRGTALVIAHGLVAAAAALTMLALVASAPVPVVIAASASLTMTIAVVRPIHFAALPQLAEGPQELVSANSLSSVADGLFSFLGPVAAGVLTALLGYPPVFAIAAALAVLASLLCVGLHLGAPIAAEHEEGGLRAAAQGLIALWGDWGSLALLFVMTLVFVLTGALDVLGVSYSSDVLGREQTGAGFVVGAMGIGASLGALLAASVGGRRRLAPVIVIGAALAGACFGAVSLSSALVPTMVILVLAGIGGAVMLVAGRTLLQRATDDRVLARVFAVQESTTLIGTALGAAVVPALISWLTPRYAFIPIGIAAVVMALTGLVLIRRLDDRAVFRPAENALLRSVPFLAVLPAYDLERLAQNARWEVVLAGDVVLRQGDPGDAFYVVAEGTLSVTVDDVLLPKTLTAGTGFGEIALLLSVPRTATIMALTQCRLLVIDPDDFLAAVTGSVDGHAIAAEVSAAHLARDRRAA